MNKELLQQKAEAYAEKTLFSNGVSCEADYLAGAKEILDNPELYGLVKKDTYDISVAFRIDLYAEYTTLEKENKELKEKVAELERVTDQQRTEPCSE